MSKTDHCRNDSPRPKTTIDRRDFLIPMILRSLLFLLAVSLSSVAQQEPAPGALTLWYDKPAAIFNARNEAGGTYKTMVNEGLPIGNGYIGAMIKGGAARELLRLNDKTLWTGGLNPSGSYTSLGAYQALGDLSIDLNGQELTSLNLRVFHRFSPAHSQHLGTHVDGKVVQPRVHCMQVA